MNNHYIKLTRFDNTPIWLNAAFIVTVEPRRQGGAVVVPIGDGLDYDVRESPEAVLAMLEGSPAAEVVPVPAPEALTKKPDDVSAEPVTMSVADAVELKDEPEPKPEPAPEAAPEAKPEKKKTAKKTATRRPRTKKGELKLTDDQVERLKKMAPGSVKKLANTLTSQFKIDDAEGTVKALVEKGVLEFEQDHVIWK